jgi:hypothetical protein
MLQFLTDGTYDPENGLYCTPIGQPCYYYASDNLWSLAYKGLTPEDLVDISVDFGLHFDGAAQQGVVFHLIGALSEYGKLGTVCIGGTCESAEKFYHDAVAVLDREAPVTHVLRAARPPRSKARQDAGRQEDGAR